MSLLSRAYRLTRKQQYRSSALRALPALRVAVTKGGLKRCFFGNCARPFFEEYPTSPPSYVLNGFMFTLIGLYDLASIAPRSPALSMYQAGRRTLTAALPQYDVGGFSTYDLSRLATRRWPGGSPTRIVGRPGCSRLPASRVGLAWSEFALPALRGPVGGELGSSRWVTLGMIREILGRILGHSDRPVAPAGPYVPAEYWENRADALIEGYDAPESWEQRGWLKDGVEEVEVPPLSPQRCSICSRGRGGVGASVPLSTIAPPGDQRLRHLADARRCMPEPLSGDRNGRRRLDWRCRAARAGGCVPSTTALQHIPPHEIRSAVAATKSLARRLVVMRETTYLRDSSQYQFAHDYDELFEDWRSIHRAVTDENDLVRVELIAWTPSPEPDRRRGDSHSTSSR